MDHRLAPLLGVLVLASSPVAAADPGFGHLSVRLERNVSDGDFEVVFEASGRDAGLSGFKVAAPDGRVVVDFHAPRSRLGMRTFRIETPEPSSLERLRADFPAGVYTFSARTVNGGRLEGTSRLSHRLPAAATVVHPRSNENAMPTNGLRVEWIVPPGAASIVITIENDRTGNKAVQATMPGDATGFPVPDGLLERATRYRVAIGTVGPDGNASVVESAFTTGGGAS